MPGEAVGREKDGGRGNQTKPEQTNQVKLKQTSALLPNNKRAERRRFKIAKARSGERRGGGKKNKNQKSPTEIGFQVFCQSSRQSKLLPLATRGGWFHCTVLVFEGKSKEQQEQEGKEEEEEEEKRGQGGEGEDGGGRRGGRERGGRVKGGGGGEKEEEEQQEEKEIRKKRAEEGEEQEQGIRKRREDEEEEKEKKEEEGEEEKG